MSSFVVLSKYMWAPFSLKSWWARVSHLLLEVFPDTPSHSGSVWWPSESVPALSELGITIFNHFGQQRSKGGWFQSLLSSSTTLRLWVRIFVSLSAMTIQWRYNSSSTQHLLMWLDSKWDKRTELLPLHFFQGSKNSSRKFSIGFLLDFIGQNLVVCPTINWKRWTKYAQFRLVVLRPTGAASPGNSLEIQTWGLLDLPLNQKFGGWGPGFWVLNVLDVILMHTKIWESLVWI